MKAANSRAAENKLQVTEKEETKEYRVCRNLAVAPPCSCCGRLITESEMGDHSLYFKLQLIWGGGAGFRMSPPLRTQILFWDGSENIRTSLEGAIFASLTGVVIGCWVS